MVLSLVYYRINTGLYFQAAHGTPPLKAKRKMVYKIVQVDRIRHGTILACASQLSWFKFLTIKVTLFLSECYIFIKMLCCDFSVFGIVPVRPIVLQPSTQLMSVRVGQEMTMSCQNIRAGGGQPSWYDTKYGVVVTDGESLRIILQQ